MLNILAKFKGVNLNLILGTAKRKLWKRITIATCRLFQVQTFLNHMIIHTMSIKKIIISQCLTVRR
jgi:hypothetical protein